MKYIIFFIILTGLFLIAYLCILQYHIKVNDEIISSWTLYPAKINSVQTVSGRGGTRHRVSVSYVSKNITKTVYFKEWINLSAWRIINEAHQRGFYSTTPFVGNVVDIYVNSEDNNKVSLEPVSINKYMKNKIENIIFASVFLITPFFVIFIWSQREAQRDKPHISQ